MSVKRFSGWLLLGVAIVLLVAGILPDALSLTTADSVRYTDQPFVVHSVERESANVIHIEVDRTICYDELFPLPVISFTIPGRALVSTANSARYGLPPGEGYAGPGCRLDTRLLEVQTTAPRGIYYLEGVSDIQTRWSRHQLYWRTVDFEIP